MIPVTRGLLMRINRVVFSGALALILRRRFHSPLLWTHNPLTARYLNRNAAPDIDVVDVLRRSTTALIAFMPSSACPPG